LICLLSLFVAVLAQDLFTSESVIHCKNPEGHASTARLLIRKTNGHTASVQIALLIPLFYKNFKIPYLDSTKLRSTEFIEHPILGTHGQGVRDRPQSFPSLPCVVLLVGL
jgi:hypothetical protein